jgi:hypothetical protein
MWSVESRYYKEKLNLMQGKGLAPLHICYSLGRYLII